MGADYDMAATPGLEEGGYEYYTLAGAERLRDALAEFERRERPRLRARAAVQVSAGAVRGGVPAARALHAAGHPRLGADGDDVPDAAPGPGDRRGLADVPRRARRAGHRGAARSTSSRASIRRPRGAAGERRDAALRPLRRDPGPPGARSARGLGPRRRRLGARRPDQPQDPVPAASTPSGTSAPAPAPSPRPGSSPSRPRWSSPTTSRRRSPAGSHRRRTRASGRLLRRVRRRARQQGRGQLPRRPGAGRPQRNEPSRAYAAEKEEFGATRRARWFGR